MGNQEVRCGEIYLHSSGIEYRVEKIVLDATNYETQGQLRQKVLYTQLQDGKKCPRGTQFVRDIDDFLANFKPKS